MASKEKRKNYDLKEIEDYYRTRTKTFLKRLAVKREKENFKRTAKRLSIKK